MTCSAGADKLLNEEIVFKNSNSRGIRFQTVLNPVPTSYRLAESPGVYFWRNNLLKRPSLLSFVFLKITIEAMKSDIDEVALQGIEFWSNVCDEEMDLAIEASEVRSQWC